MRVRRIDVNQVRIFPFLAEDAQPSSTDVILDVRYDLAKQQPVIELTVGKGYLINAEAWECLAAFVFELLRTTQEENRATRNSPSIQIHAIDQAVWDALHTVGKPEGTILHTLFFRPVSDISLTAHLVRAATCAEAIEERFDVDGHWLNRLEKKPLLVVEGKVTFLLAE